MAAVAGIGDADADRQVRPGNAQAVIGSVVDAHIEAAGHVALLALGPRAHLEENLAAGRSDGLAFFPLLLVKMMGCGILNFFAVTLQAQGIALFDAPGAVDIVAVAAAHVPVVHLALGK